MSTFFSKYQLCPRLRADPKPAGLNKRPILTSAFVPSFLHFPSFQLLAVTGMTGIPCVCGADAPWTPIPGPRTLHSLGDCQPLSHSSDMAAKVAAESVQTAKSEEDSASKKTEEEKISFSENSCCHT